MGRTFHLNTMGSVQFRIYNKKQTNKKKQPQKKPWALWDGCLSLRSGVHLDFSRGNLKPLKAKGGVELPEVIASNNYKLFANSRAQGELHRRVCVSYLKTQLNQTNKAINMTTVCESVKLDVYINQLEDEEGMKRV